MSLVPFRSICALLLGALLAACGSTTPVQRTQKLVFETDPPGAELFLVEGERSESLGTAPVTRLEPYTAMRFESTPACWVTPVAGLGTLGLTGLWASGVNLSSPSVGEVVGLALLGTIGITLLGPAGIVRCVGEAGEDGRETPVAMTGLGREIEARAPGLAPQRLHFPAPGADRKLSFALSAVGSRDALAAARHTGPASVPAASGFVAGAAQPNAFALVIGVERYRDLPPPTGARADAERFAALATSTLGVPARNLKLALDDRAAKSDLEKHLAWLENNVPAGGRIYVFFAGHGAPDPASGTSYLLPYDADPAALPGTALKLSELTARLGRTKARTVVAFLDSCFSGTGGRSVLAAGTRPLVPVQKLVAPAHVSVLAAVSGGQTSGAHPEGGGLFSHYLFEALGEGKADHDGDGQITLGEVANWLAPRVEREARRDNREQLPWLSVGPGGEGAATALAIGGVNR